MKKSIIITGADGFIGSHLVEYLSQRDYLIYALIIQDSSTRYRIENMSNVKIIECDLFQYEKISDKIPKNTAAFFHFAWSGVSPESRKCIEKQKINLALTMNAIKLAASVETQRFIFPGSTMEYSYSNHIINNEAVPSPQNAYGAVKVACRYLCEEMCRECNIEFNYIVISGIYSEDRIDNNVIYYTITTLLKNEKPKLTKLEQLWDYVHIDDVVRALELIVKYGKNGRFYTIGHGDNTPLYNYIYKIRDMINPNLELGIGEVEYKDGVIPMSCVDLKAINEDTGYVPHISFDEGICRVIAKVKEKIK